METKKSKKANLENKKLLFFEVGLAVTLLLAILSFEWRTHDKTVSVAKLSGNGGVIEEIIPITIPELPPPPPVAPPTTSDIIVIVENTEKIKDNLIFFPEDNKNIWTDFQDYVPKKPIVEKPIEEEIPVAVVDEKPKFMGGDENEFTRWVFRNMTYPDIAKENHIQGKVYCSFAVAPDGSVVDVKILRGVDPSLDKEAVRVLSMSPKWTPGKQRNQPVRVRYTFPVAFQLK